MDYTITNNIPNTICSIIENSNLTVNDVLQAVIENVDIIFVDGDKIGQDSLFLDFHSDSEAEIDDFCVSVGIETPKEVEIIEASLEEWIEEME